MKKTEVYPTHSIEAQLLAEVRDNQEKTNELLKEQNKLLLQLIGQLKVR